VRKIMMIVGVASLTAAFAILGHDAQAWFDRGSWSSTTVGGMLELMQLNDNALILMGQFWLIHSILNLPFYLASLAIGVTASFCGYISNERT
jgi:hypothetical protein